MAVVVAGGVEVEGLLFEHGHGGRDWFVVFGEEGDGFSVEFHFLDGEEDGLVFLELVGGVVFAGAGEVG